MKNANKYAVGDEVVYLGVTMTVLGVLSSYSALYCEYSDDNGVIHSKTLEPRHLPFVTKREDADEEGYMEWPC